ncbi:MAG: putative quinol monooxygenase, partial [Bradyrhizobium sp.]
MNLRLVQFSLGPGKRAVAESIADKIVPAIRARPGCERCVFFADNDAGDYGLIVLWESAHAAEAAAAVIGPIFMPALQAAGTSAT